MTLPVEEFANEGLKGERHEAVKELSEYHLECVCGHSIVSHQSSGVCRKCGRGFEIQRGLTQSADDAALREQSMQWLPFGKGRQ